MKGRIAILKISGEKILLNADEIKTVKENKSTGHTEIHMYENERRYYVTDEPFDEIFKKIVDASAEEKKGTEYLWAIMSLLFKSMHENGDAARIEPALKPKEPVPQEHVTESTWVMMGGFPACEKCGCSPADWEDGFPPYCHSCGARMKNGRK